MIHQELVNRNKKLAVIGLGYVGLPLALEFAHKMDVVAFDIDPTRVDLMKKNIDPSSEVPEEAFLEKNIEFTSNLDDLKNASFYIVAVPTPLNEENSPKLHAIHQASKFVGQVLSKGDYVVFESTVFPSCTEDECVPILEKYSSLKNIEDFKTGYSPERINPGDKKHSIKNIMKVVSGCDTEALNEIAKVYEEVVEAGIYKAPSIKVAEASKIIENTQRDINIALMNEFSLFFDRLGINTFEVLQAASTKWNFLPFTPGLVGGHCIGVDSYYLTFKSEQLGYTPQVILAGRNINDKMPAHVAKKLVQDLIKNGTEMKSAKVLVMGVTFKQDVADIRNSKVVDLIQELQSYNLTVDVVDPYASGEAMNKEYSIELSESIGENYDAVVLAVNHAPYREFDEAYFKSILTEKGIFVDIKGVYRNKIKNLAYWSL